MGKFVKIVLTCLTPCFSFIASLSKLTKINQTEKVNGQPNYFRVTDEQSGYKDEILLTNMSNRHGCITGATGTGKTVSLQKLAESFSKKGVPVFLADIKGDLSGHCKSCGADRQDESAFGKASLADSGLVSLPGCVLGCLRSGRFPRSCNDQ